MPLIELVVVQGNQAPGLPTGGRGGRGWRPEESDERRLGRFKGLGARGLPGLITVDCEIGNRIWERGEDMGK